MAIARLEEFINNLKNLDDDKEIKILCNRELDYLRKELNIIPVYSENGYPNGVDGDARRLKTQISQYRSEIKKLATNDRNSTLKIVDGMEVYKHKALKYFNLEEWEKKDVARRDRTRVKKDKRNRSSFDAVAVIERSLSLLESESYVSKVAGLYLLTGRRHEEILVTGEFDMARFNYDERDTKVEQWLKFSVDSASFKGQVKRKSNEDKPYNIPLLAQLDIVRHNIFWLRKNKPHQKGQRPKGSKELGLKVRKEFQESGLLPLPGGKDTYLNPHNLRSAYAAICWQLYRHTEYGRGDVEDEFIKEIMGHKEDTTESAQSYLDYEINLVETKKLFEYHHGETL